MINKIILGFPGVGKTYCASKMPNVLDITTVKAETFFKNIAVSDMIKIYIMMSNNNLRLDVDELDLLTYKVIGMLLYELNNIDNLNIDYILLSSKHSSLVNRLGIPYTMVIPEYDDKDLYYSKYLYRAKTNTANSGFEFADRMINNWDSIYRDCVHKSTECCIPSTNTKILKSKQSLYDLLLTN